MKKILKALAMVLAFVIVFASFDTQAQWAPGTEEYEAQYGNSTSGGSGWTPGSSNQLWDGSIIEPKGSTPSLTNTSSSSAKTSSSGGSSSNTQNGNAKEIFTTIESKLYNTLMDLREIVYVIAGFGLVMFAVMAIFNKISYKHLGYIMIGLSLLALMFPFIEYFSGYTTAALQQQRELTFKSFLDPNVSYEYVQGTGYKEITSAAYDGDMPSEEEFEQRKAGLSAIESADLQGLVSTEGLGGGLAGMEQRTAVINAGCNPITMKGAWDPQTLKRTVCEIDANGNVKTSSEVCKGGKIDKLGQCKASIMTTLNNIMKGTQQAVSTATNAIGAGVSAWNTLKTTGKGFENIIATIENGDYSNLGAIANSIQGIMGSINTANNNMYGGLQNTLSNMNNAMSGSTNLASLFNTDYENNPTGENSYSNWWNGQNEDGEWNSGFRNALDKIGDKADDIHDAVDTGTGFVGGTLGTVQQGAEAVNTILGLDQKRAAEEAAARAAAEAAAAAARQEQEQQQEQQQALNSLSSDQINAAVDAGLLTQEQADAIKAAQEENAKAEEEKKAAECEAQRKAAQAAVDAANQNVAAAQEALSKASTPGEIASAMKALEAAQKAASSAQGRAASVVCN